MRESACLSNRIAKRAIFSQACGDPITLEFKRNKTLWTLEQGRTTTEEVWRNQREVASAQRSYTYAETMHSRYVEQQKTYHKEHPIKAALGLSPQVYDQDSCKNRPLAELVEASRTRFKQEQAEWDSLCAKPEPWAAAKEQAREQNAAVGAAERRLPEVERALKGTALQHKADLKTLETCRAQERSREREHDRGFGFER